MITYNNKEYRNLEEQVLKNKQDIAYHYEIDRTLANFGIKVIGVLANVSELPVPYTGDYGDAYAVGNPGDYTYYIWTRANPDLGEPAPFWLNAGKLAVDAELGTIVTVDGEKQVTWNADTKLDKVTINNGKAAYVALGNGKQGMASISVNNYTAYPNTGINTDGAVAGYVQNHWGVERPDGNGVLLSNDPTQPYQVATKNYVDTTTANKSTTSIGAGNMNRIFGMKQDGTIGWYYTAGQAGMGFYTYFIPCYLSNSYVPTAAHEEQLNGSVLFTGPPKHPYQCANKKYVDAATALYKTTIEIEDGLTGESYVLYMNTHKYIEGSGMELQELCQLLSESEEDDDYSGMNAFVFEHIATSQGLYFIAAIQNNIEDDGTIMFATRVGNQSSFLAINASALCVVSQTKV